MDASHPPLIPSEDGLRVKFRVYGFGVTECRVKTGGIRESASTNKTPLRR